MRYQSINLLLFLQKQNLGSCGHVSTKKNVRGIKDAATSTPPQLRSSRYIRYRDNIGYPRYGERYDIGDNQYSSNNLPYCPINRFLESISNLMKVTYSKLIVNISLVDVLTCGRAVPSLTLFQNSTVFSKIAFTCPLIASALVQTMLQQCVLRSPKCFHHVHNSECSAKAPEKWRQKHRRGCSWRKTCVESTGGASPELVN